jgi:hypothetical protein
VFSIANRLIEDDNFWNETIYNICKGDVVNMRELRKMDIFDFFSYLEQYGRGTKGNSKDRRVRKETN